VVHSVDIRQRSDLGWACVDHGSPGDLAVWLTASGYYTTQNI